MSGDFYELNELIHNNKNTKYLTQDIVYTGRGNHFGLFNDGFRDGIKINQDNITIEGNNHTIDANGKIRIFQIKGKNVTLKNITFKNGCADDYGGAIRNDEGQINLINCKFINNTAKENGNDISNTPESEIKIENCEFSQNNDKYHIWNYGSITIHENQIDKPNNLILGGTIKYIKDTLISIEKIDTEKSVDEIHTLTIKLMDTDDNILNNRIIKLSNEMKDITDNNGLVTFHISFDKPGENRLNILYEGDKEDNIIYNASQTVSVDFLTINNSHNDQPNVIQNNYSENIFSNEHVKNTPFPAYQGKDQYIFVSYAHIDWKLVYPELTRFNNDGYNIWYDEGITSGSTWDDEVADALSDCSLFVVFITPNSISRKNIKKEINYADNEDKPIIPIYLVETTLKRGLKLRLEDTESIFKYVMTDDQYISKYNRDFKKYIKSNQYK